jgi:hypothetical protein
LNHVANLELALEAQPCGSFSVSSNDIAVAAELHDGTRSAIERLLFIVSDEDTLCVRVMLVTTWGADQYLVTAVARGWLAIEVFAKVDIVPMPNIVSVITACYVSLNLACKEAKSEMGMAFSSRQH